MTAPSDVLRDAFTYHSWATLGLLDAIDQLDRTQLDTSIPGTYGSILETLTHLVDADDRYLQRLVTTEVPPSVDHRLQEVDELRPRVEANDARWSDKLHELEAGSLAARIRGRGDGYPDVDHAEGLLLLQALHHGNDHRTQVCSTLGTLGLEVPDIDVWSFWASRA